MFVIATNTFNTQQEAQEELEECYDPSYKIYQVNRNPKDALVSFILGICFVWGVVYWAFIKGVI
jgi:hypothetical protein